MDTNLLIALGIAAVGIAAAIFGFGMLPGDDDLRWRGKDLRNLHTGDHRRSRPKTRLERLKDRLSRRKGR